MPFHARFELGFREVACALQACESEAMVVKKKLLSCYAALHAVRFGRERIGTIAVCWRDGFDLTGLELITLQQCSIVFRIMVQHQIMMEDAALSRRETFACDLIYGIAESEEAAITQASIMKWKMAYPILILAMVIPPPRFKRLLRAGGRRLPPSKGRCGWSIREESAATASFGSKTGR